MKQQKKTTKIFTQFSHYQQLIHYILDKDFLPRRTPTFDLKQSKLFFINSKLYMAGQKYQRIIIMTQQIVFPNNDIVKKQSQDISSFKKLLINQAKELNLKAQSWFRLSKSQEQYTILQCKHAESCRATIKLIYNQTKKNFEVEQVNNIHDHSEPKKSQVEQFNNTHKHSEPQLLIQTIQVVAKIKQNYLLNNKLENYKKSEFQKNLDNEKTFHLEIGCSCASNPGPAAIAYCLKTDSEQYFRSSRSIGQKTNNEAQFTALIQGLLDCYENKVKRIKVFTSSTILFNSLGPNGKVKSINLMQFWEAAKLMCAQFESCEVLYKKRQKGDYLNKLCKFRLKI